MHKTCHLSLVNMSLSLLQAVEAKDVNIIVEKVAFDGVTRFEDRYRLPLGVRKSGVLYSFTCCLLPTFKMTLCVLLTGYSQSHRLQRTACHRGEAGQYVYWLISTILKGCQNGPRLGTRMYAVEVAIVLSN